MVMKKKTDMSRITQLRQMYQMQTHECAYVSVLEEYKDTGDQVIFYIFCTFVIFVINWVSESLFCFNVVQLG